MFWYTLEGRDEDGNPTGGWDLQELRSIQDWYLRYELMSVPGVAEVASVGGFVREYQVDVDPEALAMASALDAARAAKDFATADSLRAQLQDAGWTVETTRDGTTLRR